MSLSHAPDLHRHRALPITQKPGSAFLRWTVAALGLTIVVAVCVLLSRAVQDPERFPVNHVDVLGTLDYADRTALMKAVQKHTVQGFYALKIDVLRADVERFAWVDKARVSRVWPARITVDVEEHEPAGRWNNSSLISKQLKVFNPPQLRSDSENYQQWRQVFQSLPQLRGTPGRQAALLGNYRLYQQQLAAINLNLALLDEDDRHSQTLVLSNNVTVQLGYEHHLLRMDRFMDVYPRLADQFADDISESTALSFDMRYSNGFSLGRVSESGIWQ